MEDKLSLEDVDSAVITLRSTFAAVDELVRRRAAEAPYVLPSTARLASTLHDGTAREPEHDTGASQVPRDGHQGSVPAPLTRTRGPKPAAEAPYLLARAAAADASCIAETKARAMLKPPKKSPTASPQPMAATKQLSHNGRQAQGADAEAAAARKLLTLPGQLPYRQMLVTARQSRAIESQAFLREMEGLDGEIDSYLAADKYARAASGAATVLQTAWRARGPRLMFNRYWAQRRAAEQRALSDCLAAMRVLVHAIRHHCTYTLKTCFAEWRALHDLKMELFVKVIERLKNSMIDVRDSQSPGHLWLMCTAPGEDPSAAKISLGSLCRSLILSQAPRRRMGGYFRAWRASVAAVMGTRQNAAAILFRLGESMALHTMHQCLRFWYRWAQVKLSERLGITPPLFRPRMDEWDRWLWEHSRSVELRKRMVRLLVGHRLRYCFTFLRKFAVRNRSLRTAWVSAAIPMIEATLRHAMGCLKANWQHIKAQRRLRGVAFRAWLRLTHRNIQVRSLAKRVEAVARKYIKLLAFRRIRLWRAQAKLLALGATVQILQRRALCMVPLCAWIGDRMQMWFVAAWQAWKNLVLGKLRMRCFLVNHLERAPFLRMDLAFKAWRKVTAQQAEHRRWVKARWAEREEQRPRVKAAETVSQLAAAAAAMRPSFAGRSVSRARGRASSSGVPQLEVSQSIHSHVATPTLSDAGSTQSKQQVDVNNDTAEHRPDDFELCEELDEGSVVVSYADFVPGPLWRPLVPMAEAMAAWDTTAAGLAPAALQQLVRQLVNVDGPFSPAESQGERQLVLEGWCERRDTSPVVKQMFKPENDALLRLWLDAPSASQPDPWLWQRLVGLLACSSEWHPEAPCGVLIDHMALPWAEEVGRMKLRQTALRLRAQTAGLADDNHDASPTDVPADGSGGDQEPQERSGAVKSEARGKHAVALTEREQEVVWLHRLAFCEALLEGVVAGLLQVGHKQLPAVYAQVARLRKPSQQQSSGAPLTPLEGDLLVRLLEGALQHDVTYMCSALQYRRNRDRVITMGMSLHRHALALHKHCPEFTLAYPDYNPAGTWAQIIMRVDEQDSDILSPADDADFLPDEFYGDQHAARGTGAAAAQAAGGANQAPSPVPVAGSQAADAGRFSASGATGRGAISKLPLPSGGLSTSERIKMEMLGIPIPADVSPRAQSPQLGAKRSPLSGSPTATARGLTPPDAARTQTSPKTAGSGPLGPGAGGTGSQASKPAVKKPLSLQELAARGIVLGAAAVAILEAKAAAAKREAGHRASNAAQIAQMLSKPATPYKQAWRPSGYRKVAPKDQDQQREARPRRIKRLPPLPDLLKRPKEEDDAATERNGGGGGVTGRPPGASKPNAPSPQALRAAAALASGQAAGDAALRAMMAASAAHGAPGLGHGGNIHAAVAAVAGTFMLRTAAARPPPPPPYVWFASETRLFPSVADIPMPSEVPSMQDLHHRATHLVTMRLDAGAWPLPLLPSVVYEEAQPPPQAPAQHVSSQGQGAPAQGQQQISNTAGAANVGGSSVQALVRTADAAGAPSDAVSSGREAAQAAPRLALDDPAKQRLVQLGLGLAMPSSSTAPASFTKQYSTAMFGDAAARIKDGADDSPMCTPSDSAAASPMVTPRSQEQPVHSPLAPPVRQPFVATAQQIRIFLGGHVHEFRLTAHRRGAGYAVNGGGSGDAAAAKDDPDMPRKPIDAYDRLAAAYDGIMASGTMSVTSPAPSSTLEGWDLETELADLLESDTAVAALAGAEVALLGDRQLTFEEHAQVQMELDRLETELIRAGRATRRGMGGARGSPRQTTSPIRRLARHMSSSRQGSEAAAGSGSHASPPMLSVRLGADGSVSSMARSRSSHLAIDSPASIDRLRTPPAAVGVAAEPVPFGSVSGAAALSPVVQLRLPDLQQRRQVTSVSPWASEQHAAAPGAEASWPKQGAAVKAGAESPTRTAMAQGPSHSFAPTPIHQLGGPAEISSSVAPDSPQLAPASAESSRLDTGGPELTPGGGDAGDEASAHGVAPHPDASGPSLVQEGFPGAGLLVRHPSEVVVLDELPVTPRSAAAETGLMFSGDGSTAGWRQRRRSNLRAMAASFDTSGGLGGAGLGPVPEGIDEASAGELEALRAMWSAGPYSGSQGLEDAGEHVARIIAAAADEDWQRHERAAEHLVEQLSHMLSQREALASVAPRLLGHRRAASASVPGVRLGRPGRSAAGHPAAATTQHMAAVMAATLTLGAEEGGQGGDAQRRGTGGPLQRALSLMEDNLAAAIDPDKLTGLGVSSYPERLSDLMSRLVVAPMATRYLFWKKVQSVQMMKQRLREDRALEAQLADVVFAATFAPGQSQHPSGWQPRGAMQAAEAALPAPAAADTGAPPGLQLPAGWSAGALSIISAPRVPWRTTQPPLLGSTAAATAGQNGPLPPVRGAVAVPILRAMTLQPRTEVPRWGMGRLMLPPVVENSCASSSLWSNSQVPPNTADVNAAVPLPRGAVQHEPLPPVKDQELLARRLGRLLEAHVHARLRALEETRSALTTPGSHGTGDSWDAARAASEERDAAMQETSERLARLTISLHRELLARFRNRHSDPATLAGRGRVMGWGPPPRLPPGYNGRDFQDAPNSPFTVPPRPRLPICPPAPVSITLKGAPFTRVTTEGRREAEAAAAALTDRTEPMELVLRPTPTVTSENLASHLPHPYAQSRPVRAFPLLEPMPTVPAYTTSELQLGNVLFVTPRMSPWHVDAITRAIDNAFVPGPHATGGEQLSRELSRLGSSVLTSRAPSRDVLSSDALGSAMRSATPLSPVLAPGATAQGVIG